MKLTAQEDLSFHKVLIRHMAQQSPHGIDLLRRGAVDLNHVNRGGRGGGNSKPVLEPITSALFYWRRILTHQSGANAEPIR